MNYEEANSRWKESRVPITERSNYKSVWDRQARDIEVATLAVVGALDDIDLDAMARCSIDQLKVTAGITRNDVILEIGCGIARVGKVLSQECLHWVGCDISGEMLRHAALRLKDRPNTTLVELATVGLMEFPRDSFDLVYCTVVFMHLLPWDRYKYVEESFRVLRPGGHCYFDNVPLDSDHGWKVFTESASYPIERRPAHISMNSTREEMLTFLSRAGFEKVEVRDLPNGFIAATGQKPE